MPKKILVVDDEEKVCRFLKGFFEDEGLEVFTASNGQDALKIVKNEKLSKVLLDIKMKGMNGLEVLKGIRELYPHLQVIMVTGLEDIKTIEEATALGASHYITKPFVLKELHKIIMETQTNE